MKFSAPIILASAATVLSVPTGTLQKREDFCGQYDSVESGSYTVYNNLWGMESATGEQCTGVTSGNGSSLAWHTNWTWSGRYERPIDSSVAFLCPPVGEPWLIILFLGTCSEGQVISYANAVFNTEAKQISAIGSAPSTWSWTYEGDSLVANVAYDLFTSSSADGDEEYEVMIWLAALGGAGPISETGEAIASADIAGTTWSLWEGTNGQMHVFSFVVDGDNVQDFSGDLKEFLDYLTTNQSMPESQYVINIGAGTEPFR